MCSVPAARRLFLPLFLGFLMFANASLVAAESAAERREVDLARGMELINAGKYREALEPLLRTVAADPLEREALFYAGLAHSRLGEYEAAAALLARSLAIEETAEATLELGRVQALTNRCGEARQFFARSEALGAEAADLRIINGLLLGCGDEGEAAPFRFSLTAGWQYDSNAILEPLRPAIKKPVKDDQIAAIFLSAGATPWRTGSFALNLDYSFFGNLHVELDDYDTVLNRLSTTLALTPWKPVRPVLGYTFEHTSYGGDSYSRTHRGSLQVEVREGARASTEAVFEVRDTLSWNTALFSDNAERSGDGQSAGLRQRLLIGNVDMTISFFGDWDQASREYWATEGWRTAARLSWRPTKALSIGLSGEYLERDFQAPFPGKAAAREDRTTTWGASISHALGRLVAVTLAGSRTSNESNLEAYRYTRTIIGLYLTFGLGG